MRIIVNKHKFTNLVVKCRRYKESENDSYSYSHIFSKICNSKELLPKDKNFIDNNKE